MRKEMKILDSRFLGVDFTFSIYALQVILY